MTRMVGDNRPGDEPESDMYEDEPPRSIFSAVWFRVVVVVVVLGVIAAVAVPYVLDWVSPTSVKIARPKPPTPAARPPAATPAPPAPPPAAAPAPAEPMPPPAAAPMPAPAAPEKVVAAKPAAEKPVATAPAPAKAQAPTAATPAAPAAKKPAAPARRAAKAAPKGAATKVTAGTGTYWVQVGAFREAAAASRVAGQLRARKYTVEESLAGTAATPAPGGRAPASGTDLYDIFVSGGSAAEINARLAARGLAAEAAAGGAVVKPSLPLRDAVALSKDLAGAGMKVQVKRAGGAAAGAPAPAVTAAAGEALHRVRVGPYPDRAAARAALRELEAAGFKPYIAREGR